MEDEINTFGELNREAKILKPIKKHGLSIGITFNKEEEEKFNLAYGDLVDLSNAKIIKK